MNNDFTILPAVFVLALAILACSSLSPQAKPAATEVQQPSVTKQPQGAIPQTEADVPRISVKDAEAAFDNSKAVIVDVRSAESYAAGHIAGAISIPLTGIETDPAGVNLDKEQWIITYCT
jgi:3-mercaptopyruvate sulfurtransferase SseA